VGALVAVLLFAGLTEAFFIHQTTIGPRKVMPTAPPVTLRVMVVHPDGKQEPGAEHAKLAERDVLHAQAELPRDTFVSLVRAGDNAGFEPLVLNQQGKNHLVDFDDEGKPLAVSLDNLSGPQHLFALTCDRPLAIDEAISAAKGVVPPGVGLSAFDFQVGR
jgi:hypothetical protein